MAAHGPHARSSAAIGERATSRTEKDWPVTVVMRSAQNFSVNGVYLASVDLPEPIRCPIKDGGMKIRPD